MKRISIPSAVFLFASSALSHSAIIVVDVIDSVSITLSHLGSDSIALSGFPSINRIDVNGDGSPEVPSAALSSTSAYFTDGSATITPSSFSTSRFYVSSNSFQNGAGPGLNYARYDLDGDRVYETVVEFDFGADLAFSDDLITRYAYDDGAAALSIPDAVTEFNRVPEPSSIALFGLAGLGLLFRRR